ncbi:plasmid replication initiator TrfA [Burkholderia pseudomallei]|uniref:plasmid replication initiator TrfA n=1 Tax=Burkholderia pseudomallei TaxID=28450 RepID=UPI00100AEEC2|nr:plasmid replication initiator TrfA [Burkholderia pseudomallei]
MSDALLLDALVAERDRETGAAPSPTPQVWQQPFPLVPWHPANAPIIPNELVRCALFRVADPASKRERFTRDRLPVQAARDGYIEYTGEELRQDDRRVFMHALHLEGETPGSAIFRPRKFCHDIGWGTSNAAYEKLLDTLSRLKATSLRMFIPRLGRPGVEVSLIARLEFFPGSKPVRVWFDREIAELFRDQHYTRILSLYEDRLTRRSYLASWLLGFYASHREPVAFPLERLQKLCGDHTPLKEFRRKTALALQQLVDVKFLESFAIQDGSVTCQRAAAPPESRNCPTAIASLLHRNRAVTPPAG